MYTSSIVIEFRHRFFLHRNLRKNLREGCAWLCCDGCAWLCFHSCDDTALQLLSWQHRNFPERRNITCTLHVNVVYITRRWQDSVVWDRLQLVRPLRVTTALSLYRRVSVSVSVTVTVSAEIILWQIETWKALPATCVTQRGALYVCNLLCPNVRRCHFTQLLSLLFDVSEVAF
jgi:hypothetical protein